MANLKHLSLVFILGTLIAAIFNPPVINAGFMDSIKDTLKSWGGEEGLTNTDIVDGLKEALQIGTANAVSTTSKTDGYYKNANIKIPLPEDVQKVEKLLRATGFGQKVDDFELSMNRAAERAAPEAKSIFWDAIKQITFTDAREILDGRDNEATLYFKDKTSERLTEIFKPTVHEAMSEVGVTSTYQALDAKVKNIPFANELSFDLDQYVTDKALDGLFFMLAEEEKKIRQNPAARVTDLLKKVFASK